VLRRTVVFEDIFQGKMSCDMGDAVLLLLLLFSNATTCPPWTSWSPLPVVAEVQQTSEVGTPMRRGYVVPMRRMVVDEYGVPGGALKLNSNYPDHGHHEDPPLSGKNPHGRAGNRTWDLIISSQKH
jgi:hypothetical protein